MGQFLFSQFFGGSDPFGGLGGGMGSSSRRGSPPGVRMFNMSGGGPGRGRPGMQDPFSGFGSGDMGGGMGIGGMGGMGGMGRKQSFGRNNYTNNQPKRYDAIPEGTVVSLKGLVGRPERNGDRGKIVQYDPSSDRYVVYLEDSDETMKVKPSNLLQHARATIRGLEGRAELNGQTATILAWDDSKGRYNAYVPSISRAVSLKPSNIVLNDGTVGQIVGLQSKPELNGQWGTITNFNTSSGRYDVQLSHDKILRLKLENIRL